MRQAPARPYIPPPFLAAVGAVVVLSLVLVATAPLWREAPARPADPPARSLALFFRADAAGNLTVLKAEDGAVIDTLDPDRGGFIRTVARVVRRDLGPGAEAHAMPFLLQSWPDGRLALVDPATGRSIDLRAFGPTQAGVFLRLLQQEEARR
ncbi:MAG: photosynthetic complex assembly protein PuhC [Rhodovarius sp.]|nr:photosynthetic complex assembly protein PuhC [Rhodovarius sp.]MCX7932194.1 photosynthetic complex assembly protein PuhC [Rhodovarius sp.]MDW8313555.1 photosynthetic complex assembly protein PuhC [Rhodovarius sp.]